MSSSKSRDSTTALILGALGTVAAATAIHFAVTHYDLLPRKRPETRVYATKDDLANAVCKYIVQEIQNCPNPRFYLAVAGGSLLDTLRKLVEFKDQADFSSVVLCFANHKCIDPTSEKATAQKAKEKFANALNMTVVVPQTKSEATTTDGTEEAKEYGLQLLQAYVPHTGVIPKFDLVLLGLGADGHVASCHPNSDAATKATTAVTNSPKVGEPPSITLSMKALNNSKKVSVVVSGGSKGKKEAVKRAMIRPAEEPLGSFPAQLLIRPLYFLDMDAAQDI